jgi:hypothetical protein
MHLEAADIATSEAAAEENQQASVSVAEEVLDY